MFFDLTSAAREISNLQEMSASIFLLMERGDICAQENARVNKLAPSPLLSRKIIKYIVSLKALRVKRL